MDSIKSWMVGQKFLNKQHFSFWNLKKKKKTFTQVKFQFQLKFLGTFVVWSWKVDDAVNWLFILGYLKFFVTSGSNIEYFSS